MKLACIIASLVLTFSGCSRAPNDGPPLRVAAAADLKFALDALLGEFSKNGGGFPVEVIYGSSGNLRSQIEQGAPFDLFLSADMRFPEQLAAAGKADAESLFAYAVGRIVIWVPESSPVDVVTLREKALLDPSVRKIAIANPEHAPYGMAAVAAMKSLGIYDEVSPKFVLAESVAQAAQFVESRAADIGVIALSLALAPGMEGAGRFWEIPPGQFPKMLQGGAVVSGSRQKEKAKIFCGFLSSEDGQRTLRRFGFLLPGDAD